MNRDDEEERRIGAKKRDKEIDSKKYVKCERRLYCASVAAFENYDILLSELGCRTLVSRQVIYQDTG